jgi:cell division protein ZapA (FtsZ GTPase activity inhibitor)
VPDPVKETTVKIHGSSYQLRTDLNDEELSRIAAYVDGKMKELDPKRSLPPGKVSVLASMTIAGELMEERGRSKGDRQSFTDRLERLHDLLDDALGEG